MTESKEVAIICLEKEYERIHGQITESEEGTIIESESKKMQDDEYFMMLIEYTFKILNVVYTKKLNEWLECSDIESIEYICRIIESCGTLILELLGQKTHLVQDLQIFLQLSIALLDITAKIYPVNVDVSKKTFINIINFIGDLSYFIAARDNKEEILKLLLMENQELHDINSESFKIITRAFNSYSDKIYSYLYTRIKHENYFRERG